MVPIRFIPTPVGNTLEGRSRRACRPVHPHACGEHVAFDAAIALSRGSSPRQWGTPVKWRVENLADRFIPTPVGNTTARRPVRPASAVHPHACGEHLRRADRALVEAGSSPRLWGTRPHRSITWVFRRFIPTPVGNTIHSINAPTAPPVHPHACGEHSVTADRGKCEAGSSPRLWGTLVYGAFPIPLIRFIPTPVGNTPRIGRPLALRPVHPHACGEHSRIFLGEQKATGSSPRLWGTPRSQPRF